MIPDHSNPSSEHQPASEIISEHRQAWSFTVTIPWLIRVLGLIVLPMVFIVCAYHRAAWVEGFAGFAYLLATSGFMLTEGKDDDKELGHMLLVLSALIVLTGTYIQLNILGVF